MAKPFPVTQKELQEKRFQAAKDLLAASLPSLDKFNAIGDDKALESLVSNCIFLADTLIAELGYIQQSADAGSIRSLKSILDSSKDDE